MTDRHEGLTRHDLLLAVIGAPLAVAAMAAAASPVSLATAMLAGSVAAGGGLGYALFCRPPAGAGE